MNWQEPAVATWSAELPVDADGFIWTSPDQTRAGIKRVSVKGQNAKTTTESGDYGEIGNVFVQIFGFGISSVSRKVTEELQDV